jgi:DNA-binding MarR family transcriptional regulator
VKVPGQASLLNDVASEMIFPLLPNFLLTVLLGNRFYLGVIEGAAGSAHLPPPDAGADLAAPGRARAGPGDLRAFGRREVGRGRPHLLAGGGEARGLIAALPCRNRQRILLTPADTCIYNYRESGSRTIMDKPENSSIDTIARSCIAVRLRLLNRVVTNFYDDALRPLGLKVSQLNVLIVTARLGLARPAQVCEILQLDASTLSRNVKPLQTHGWLEVVPDEDARAQPFRLTAQGKRLIEKAVPAWEKAQRQATELLGDEVVGLLDKAARKLRESKPEG